MHPRNLIVSNEKISQLQSKPECIRNISIMAHVDHGKTTLADSLLASNGLISQRLAGKLRYLDSRKDEQERGITMKSSAIALVHTLNQSEYLVNLIDSPGHVDFSSEVSTAVRLCDGALILIDVVEGVCAQTIVALRQAWQEGIKPVVVLNKMDRLILELKLTPLDAYVHLSQLLEKINAVQAELFRSEVMGRDDTSKMPTTVKNPNENMLTENDIDSAESTDQEYYYDWSTGMDDIDDSEFYFIPNQGNVVFASAVDGWGFRISDFAEIYSKKLKVKESILIKTLWGNYFLNTKKKRIMRGAQEKAKKTLFIQLILENIWNVYETIVTRKDKAMADKIIENLNLQILPRDLKQSDPKGILGTVMNKWLPLSRAILDMVCEKLPSPLELTEERVERLLCSHVKSFKDLPEASQNLKQAFLKCDSNAEAPVIIFVSKMFPFERKDLPEKRPKPLTADELAARRDAARQRLAQKQQQAELQSTDSGTTTTSASEPTKEAPENPEAPAEIESDHKFIAFARIFSGTLKKGAQLFVLGPRHDCSTIDLKTAEAEVTAGVTLKDLKPNHYITLAQIDNIYLLKGRELELLNEVPAGNIIGIGELEDHILKTATISSTIACPSFIDLNFMAEPILRVAVEPKFTADIAALRKGLKLLNQADPCVQTFVQESGEHVLVTVGEVHLQRCLDDLRERFAKVEITASKPIVPFRETIVEPPQLDMVNEAIIIDNSSHNTTNEPNNHQTSTMSSSSASTLIIQQTPNKKCIIKLRAKPLPLEVGKVIDDYSKLLNLFKSSKLDLNDASVHEFYTKLKEAFGDMGPDTIDKIWAFGPNKTGPNVLLNNLKNFPRSVWSHFNPTQTCDKPAVVYYNEETNFINGFQLATTAGPLCQEPLRGVAFIAEDWNMDEYILESTNLPENQPQNVPYGPMSGQIISSVRDACRKAFMAQPQRLMVAMYSCIIQVNSEVLGRLYAVLGKRGGRILHGDLQEGSSQFQVTAQLPVIESFDFANEVRRQTSGLALPQLVFSHWETLEIDPFWEPTTEEEYLHFGEKADTENRAKKYMNAVRKRKGLRVEEQIVEFAEKQRTLTKNK